MTPLRSPVPQAHSSASSVGKTHSDTEAHRARLAFRLMRSAKISYAHAALSQNIASPFSLPALQFPRSFAIIRKTLPAAGISYKPLKGT